MQAVTTIDLDIAKSVFQVHGIDAEGKVVIRQQLRRSRILGFFRKLSPCLVGIEACASSHHWSRELQALGHRIHVSAKILTAVSVCQSCFSCRSRYPCPSLDRRERQGPYTDMTRVLPPQWCALSVK